MNWLAYTLTVLSITAVTPQCKDTPVAGQAVGRRGVQPGTMWVGLPHHMDNTQFKVCKYRLYNGSGIWLLQGLYCAKQAISMLYHAIYAVNHIDKMRK